jgi:hypothetical protein
MDNNYDVVIKSHPKDYYKLDLVVESLRYLNPQPQNIYILSPDGFYPKNTSYDSKIIYITDDQVSPFIDRSKLTHRPNWNWVNLVTILQTFTENDLYLDVQSDSFFIKEINLFAENGNPKIFQSSYNDGNSRGHKPYFNFSEKVFNISKMNSGYSYIIEFLMYDRKKLSKLLDGYSSVDELLEFCYQSVNQESYPADQEIYGNLLEKYFSSDYEFVSNFPNIQIGSYTPPSREELVEFIESNKKQDKFFICGYHTYQ